jgi:hypothetical protein
VVEEGGEVEEEEEAGCNLCRHCSCTSLNLSLPSSTHSSCRPL